MSTPAGQVTALATARTPEQQALYEKRIKNLRQFKPGQSGNPLGASITSRQAISEKFLKALDKDFKQHGKAVIATVRKTEPATYLRVVAGLLPAKVDLDLQSGSAATRSLEQVQADIQQAIEQRARQLALEMRDQALTVATVDKPVDNVIPDRPVDK